MVKTVSQETFALMCEEGKRQYPNEACGLIVCVGKKSVAMTCPNTHEKPRDNFRIAPTDYAACAKLGKIIGVWHTHTDESPEPSEADRAMCEGTGLPWYVASVRKNAEGNFYHEGPVAIDPCGYETPYTERPYVYGIHDCYTLVCDYYRREFGILMKRDYPRIEEWWSKGYDFFTENYIIEGFVSVTGQEPQVGDVFIIQSSSQVGSHIAIYIGDDKILHHCHGRLSTRDIYGGYWEKHTINHIRHKSKC